MHGGKVEAKNFVLNIGHLGLRELVVQPPTPKKRRLRIVRRILLVLAVAAVMAAMMVASAMPAFAAKPTSFDLNCTDGERFFFSNASSGKGFGQSNKSAAQSGFQGNGCERTIQ